MINKVPYSTFYFSTQFIVLSSAGIKAASLYAEENKTYLLTYLLNEFELFQVRQTEQLSGTKNMENSDEDFELFEKEFELFQVRQSEQLEALAKVRRH